MTLLTSTNYIDSIKAHIDNVKLLSKYTSLLSPSPALLKDYCFSVCKRSDLTIGDRDILKTFLKSKSSDLEDILSALQKLDIDKFKPVQNFLNGKTVAPKNQTIVEIIALFYDFEPRPLGKYLGNANKVNQEDLHEVVDREEEKEIVEEKEDRLETVNVPTGISSVVEESKLSGSKQNNSLKKKLIVGISSLAALIGGGYGVTKVAYFSDSDQCIVWEEDKYITCDCAEGMTAYEQDKGNMPVRYNESLLKGFRRINVDCNTSFFKDNKPKVWFVKTGADQHEYFSSPGNGTHPTLNKTVKPVSQYHLNKYIYPNCP
ncbi:hypothetical protein [Myroides marinus]|uniref:Uncharacterized protein n=1 Tax=Myroides marinus TaxID=703342 RepID=A0A1H6TE45_9FLAO|nr:hypothetical protein [Myroides marinus]MDM1378681.1 hypothetical protein [Myroides marinus]MDM1385952.1 hypothetical protein [Myroides marinus]MDM1393270.1 hypothetical protein [Myroides marinus]SEI78271.1 hypothetical protein SAMN04488018_104201 [Myroides marinus]